MGGSQYVPPLYETLLNIFDTQIGHNHGTDYFKTKVTTPTVLYRFLLFQLLRFVPASSRTCPPMHRTCRLSNSASRHRMCVQPYGGGREGREGGREGRQGRGRVKEGGRDGGKSKGVMSIHISHKLSLPLHNHSWKYLHRK